jgi:hypothetical protein
MKQRNFLEEAEILRIVETEHVNYEEGARRLKVRAAKKVTPEPQAPAHWNSGEKETDGN